MSLQIELATNWPNYIFNESKHNLIIQVQIIDTKGKINTTKRQDIN